jgi:prepilin-type N-terminal cleavage/methylation domain-containing protein
MKKSTKLGFTLIELLVVITIIGILATWAVALYTTQITKARDSARITDIKAVQSAIEQLYNQDSEYPSATRPSWSTLCTTFSWCTKEFLPRIPQDSKYNQVSCNAQQCNYMYRVADNEVLNWSYELSAAFESAKTLSKAQNDWWEDNFRLEVYWWNSWSLDTKTTTIFPVATASCVIPVNTLARIDSKCN